MVSLGYREYLGLRSGCSGAAVRPSTGVTLFCPPQWRRVPGTSSLGDSARPS